MNFFREAGYENEQGAGGFLDSYILASKSPSEILTMVAKAIPEKINAEMDKDNDVMSRSAAVNLVNLIGIPTVVMFLILVTRCIPLFIKLVVIFLIVLHIIIGTVFIVSTEQHKKIPNKIENFLESMKMITAGNTSA